MRYSELQTWTEEILVAVNMPGVTIAPGPELPDIPGPFVVWTPYGGPGLDADGALDAQSWQFRSAGEQMNYQSAEDLAMALDMAVISHESGKIADRWVAYIQRVGGAPSALMTDDSDRTQFVCSYVFGGDSGLSQ